MEIQNHGQQYYYIPGGMTPAALLLSLTWTASLFLTSVSRETCHFPDFLQSAPEGGDLRPWTTRMWWLYLRHAPEWAEKQDIYVKNGNMWRHREHNLKCERSPRRVYHKTSIGHCTERQLVYNRTCISEEGYNTFRVIQYNADRTHRFTCMKFVKRSHNVVQVYEGPLSDTNDVDLCDGAGLRLDEWPWTAQWNSWPTFCPVTGGFSFRTIRRLTNEDFCENEWRRSSLEVECMQGDGMDFIAPKDSSCNPFLKHGDWKRLSCWAGWEYGDFIFMIASDVGSQPRYCLRFPRVQEGEFSVLVYFSVICPTEHDGKPPHGIEYYELRMYRRGPSTCRDEDAEKCRELITSPEICAKDKVFAPHCPKTCGKCTSAQVSDINARRCWFEPTLHGEWTLQDKGGSAEVKIDRAQVAFSHFSSFQCLESDTGGLRYKTATVFDNGCAPRYSCMEFKRRNNNLLQYRISPSERNELKTEDLCVFRDDPSPLQDTYRSYYYKNLVLARNLWPAYCGINGVIPFNGTIHGRQCAGTVSDYDEESCSTRGTLMLQSKSCKELVLPLEFQCLAYIKEESVPLQQLLITRGLDGRNRFHCWVLTSYVGGGEWPWRVLYQLPTPQCSLIMEVNVSAVSRSNAALYLDDRARSKACKPHEESKLHVTQNDVTKSSATNLSYIVPKPGLEKGSGYTEILVKPSPTRTPQTPHPPITDFHSTDPTVLGVYNKASSSLIGQNLYRKGYVVLLYLLLYGVLYKLSAR